MFCNCCKLKYYHSLYTPQNGSQLSNGILSRTSYTNDASPTNGHISSHWHNAKHSSEASITSCTSGRVSGGAFSFKLITKICCNNPVYYGKPLQDNNNPNGSVSMHKITNCFSKNKLQYYALDCSLYQDIVSMVIL